MRRFRQVKDWMLSHESYISPVMFGAGFIWDNITLKRIDIWFENAVILIHLLIVTSTIFFFNAYATGAYFSKRGERISHIAPYFMQFSFGALFSAFIVLYSKSTSFTISALFIAFLAMFMVGNEFLRHRYEKAVFHIAILYIAVYSYMILIVPTILGRIGPEIFAVSGTLSLSVIALVIVGISKIAPQLFTSQKKLILSTVTGIYILFNIFYITNTIPPVPLSLREAGIYHYISRSGTTYYGRYEPAPWYDLLDKTSDTYYWQAGEPVYMFSAIFAPAELRTNIYHRWYYHDGVSDEWIEASRIGYAITGGRDAGYRGYTVKQNVFPGRWRVDVETERGQVLGRTHFTIKQSANSPDLTSDTL